MFQRSRSECLFLGLPGAASFTSGLKPGRNLRIKQTCLALGASLIAELMGDADYEENVLGGFPHLHDFAEPDCNCPTKNGRDLTAKYAHKRSRLRKAGKGLGLLRGKRLQSTSEIQRVFS